MDSLKAYAALNDSWQIETENYEGVRINFNGGWFLLRLSVHDPILPLNLESQEIGICAKVAAEVQKHLIRFDKLDLKDFNKVL